MFIVLGIYNAIGVFIHEINYPSFMFYVTFDGQATNKCILIDTYLIEFLPQLFLKVLNFVTCILLSVIRNVRKTTTFID